MKKILSVFLMILLLVSLLAGCGCKHEWEDATCEDPKTCEKCGETQGEPGDHKWKDATCEKPKTCKTCKKTSGKALGHDWQGGTCSRCEKPQPTEDSNSNTNLVEVPNLVGKQFSEVADMKDLIIMKEEVYDDFVPAGQIISQETAAGKEVVKNSWILVVVSKGPVPEVVLMPDLQNETKEDALKALQDLGFSENITIKEEENENFKKGTVIRTTPEKDTVLSEGTAITLIVSKGKKVQRVPMPNVVGITEESAKTTLDNQGLDLQIVVESVYNPSIEAGVVIESIPGPTEIVETNDTVTLKVSRGVEMKKMPNVVGMNITDAKTKLADTGFKSTPVVKYVAGKEALDTVLTQLPEVDKEYELDVEITLEVSDGSLAPKPIKKTVTIDLKGYAMASRCVVSVKRDGVEVLVLSVPKGTPSVELPDQEGLGTVYYTVSTDNGDSWIHTEEFS